jgi:hypothetical protein
MQILVIHKDTTTSFFIKNPSPNLLAGFFPCARALCLRLSISTPGNTPLGQFPIFRLRIYLQPRCMLFDLRSLRSKDVFSLKVLQAISGHRVNQLYYFFINDFMLPIPTIQSHMGHIVAMKHHATYR